MAALRPAGLLGVRLRDTAQHIQPAPPAVLPLSTSSGAPQVPLLNSPNRKLLWFFFFSQVLFFAGFFCQDSELNWLTISLTSFQSSHKINRGEHLGGSTEVVVGSDRGEQDWLQ